MPQSSEPPLDDLIAELRQRIEQRRAEGRYPPALEETLDEHFERLVGSRPASSPAVYDEIRSVVHQLQNFVYSRENIDAVSEVPGGSLAHRTVGKVVSRQVQGVLEQSQQHAVIIGRAVGLIGDITSTLGHEYDTKVLQQLDDLQLRLAEQQRELTQAEAKLAEVRSRVAGCPVDRWYGEDRFTAHFRGSADDLRVLYRGLAQRFVGCDPVLDIGFGRGEFLELLSEFGVEAHGIEVDERLVRMALGRGLDVEKVDGGVEYLERLAPDSLGGLVMIQVIEHLSPQQVLDVVSLAAEKVRPGGKVIIETVNPASLYVYARAFWIDPDHSRPVHPAFLSFLFQEAGFAQLELEFRSPVPAGESLETVNGDDELVKQVNENFDRINNILFGPQDYALIATR